MQRGVIYARYFQRHNDVAALVTDQEMVMSTTKAHDLLGHASEETTRKTVQVLGLVLMQGTFPPCKSFSLAKAKENAK